MNPRPRLAGCLTLSRPERMILQMYGEVVRADSLSDRPQYRINRRE